MKKHHLYTAVLTVILSAPAIGAAAAAAGEDMADKFFNKNNPTLTPQEQKAVAIAKRWQQGSAQGVSPVAGRNGAVTFNYGSQQNSIVCAVLQVCDVALQAGELVNGIHLGDTARWTVEPAVTGSGAGEVQHLIIKPLDVGLDTSLVVSTNRRTYHLKLRSHRTMYMPQVAFSYPEEVAAKWDAVFTNQMGVDDFKLLASETRSFLKTAVPQRTTATKEQLMEIMMAQDFQDLTGQVIKKVISVAQEMEAQLMGVLIDTMPVEKRNESVNSLLNGPVINAVGRTDVVGSQQQVDDLLDSLGF